jgi:membrane-associated phospholipid phosphatase
VSVGVLPGATIRSDQQDLQGEVIARSDLEERAPGSGDLYENHPAGFTSLLTSDAQYIATAPLRWDRATWTKATLAAAVVSAALLVDKGARNDVAENSSTESQAIADAIGPLGAEYSWGILGAFYLSGRYLHDERSASIARDGLASSLIAAGAITPLLKLASGRSRPSQTDGTFNIGTGGASFPSGHTTQAFALASVIASHYESPWVKATAYGLASAVGWSRIENNAHFTSDVVAGAIIGTIVGRTIVKLHQNAQFRVEASPALDPGSPGVALTFSIDSSQMRRFLRRSFD